MKEEKIIPARKGQESEEEEEEVREIRKEGPRPIVRPEGGIKEAQPRCSGRDLRQL